MLDIMTTSGSVVNCSNGQTPVFSALQLPATARVLLMLALAAVVSGGLPIAEPRLPEDALGLFGSAMSELVLGASFGLGVLAALTLPPRFKQSDSCFAVRAFHWSPSILDISRSARPTSLGTCLMMIQL